MMKKYPLGLHPNEIFNVVKFIVSENFKHHSPYISQQHYSTEINSVYDEELTYCQDSQVIVERDESGSILGSIRVLKWNFVDPLPIQKIFNINPLNYVSLGKVNDVFHFGRLAVQKDYPSLQLFKKLIIRAMAPVCQHQQNIAFAECDVKLLRVLLLLGIKVEVIGDSVNYLGSETIPVLFNYDGLIHFFLKNCEKYNVGNDIADAEKSMFNLKGSQK